MSGRSVVGQKIKKKGFEMKTFKPLFLTEYNRYKDDINLMNKLVFEQLHYYYYCENAPYAYHAENVFSPKSDFHDENFPNYVKISRELLALWRDKLSPFSYTGIMSSIEKNISHSKDMIDLLWTMKQLHEVVSPFIRMGEFVVPEQFKKV